jgi:hypothetical protein
MPLFFMATAQAKATPVAAAPLPRAVTYTTINMKGTSATPADTVEVVEWDAATALRDPNGTMPSPGSEIIVTGFVSWVSQ